MTKVDLATIHHEGAGAPSDVARGADGGYCVWIGAHHFTLLRRPSEGWATLGFNHRDYTICFSGNRMVHEVTDADLVLVRQATDAARVAWPTEMPDTFGTVRDHKDTPSKGTATVCPGIHATARHDAITRAINGTANAIPAPVPDWAAIGAVVELMQQQHILWEAA